MGLTNPSHAGIALVKDGPVARGQSRRVVVTAQHGHQSWNSNVLGKFRLRRASLGIIQNGTIKPDVHRARGRAVRSKTNFITNKEP